MEEFRTDSTLLHFSKQVDNTTCVVSPFFFTPIKNLKFSLLLLPFALPQALKDVMHCPHIQII